MADLSDHLCGFVLAAGLGRRLAPLTEERPKPLCPLLGRPLIDWSIDSIAPVVDSCAVNVGPHRSQMMRYLDELDSRGCFSEPVYRSIEDLPTGTAGALVVARDWIADRAVLTVNADTYCNADLGVLVASRDPERPSVAFTGAAEFGPSVSIVAAITPSCWAARIGPGEQGLYEAVWRPAAAAGALVEVPLEVDVLDCGTPGRYLDANLRLSGGESVVGAGAEVAGTIIESVLWDGAHVGRGEVLVRSIRTTQGRTVRTGS